MALLAGVAICSTRAGVFRFLRYSGFGSLLTRPIHSTRCVRIDKRRFYAREAAMTGAHAGRGCATEVFNR
jgi:hypothetical protein